MLSTENESPCSKLQGIKVELIISLTLTLSPGRGNIRGYKLQGISELKDGGQIKLESMFKFHAFFI
jgi:hypothetical protein